MAPTKWELTEQCIFLPSTHFSYVSIFVSFPLLICHLRDDRCAKRSARNNLQPCILVSLHLTLHHGVSRRDTRRISRCAAEILISYNECGSVVLNAISLSGDPITLPVPGPSLLRLPPKTAIKYLSSAAVWMFIVTLSRLHQHRATLGHGKYIRYLAAAVDIRYYILLDR